MNPPTRATMYMALKRSYNFLLYGSLWAVRSDANLSLFSNRRSRSNSAATEAEVERLHHFIKAREMELDFVMKELIEEKNRLETCAKAIYNLELAIPEAKQLLKTHEDSLAAFINIQTLLNNIKLTQEETMKDESLTSTMYSDLRSFSTKTTTRTADLIDSQVIETRNNLRITLDKICHLELELAGWKSSKRRSEKTINRLKSNHLDIEDDIEESKDAFRSIWKISSDVWVKVWKYFVREALDDYLKKNPHDHGMKPPILTLSQVCSSWRRLVYNIPELWTLVYVAPTQVWRQCEHDLFVKSIEKAHSPVTVLTNLSQDFSIYYHNRRYNLNGHLSETVSVKENTVLGGKDYALLLDCFDDQEYSMQRM
ncbi:1078_t:CDS:2, partial [Acaulospora colombiana]